MHKHDQGIDPDCQWCNLDLLLIELAGDWGMSNLDSYLKTQLDSMWRLESKRLDEKDGY